jgi:2-polyprenyl-3-methyl-5-hydroxy-6-metoxy-1,4-benzoquinol methylase/ribosomal protein S27E
MGNDVQFSEEDIRPKNVTEGAKTAILKDLGRLLMNRDKFVDVFCPACNSDKFVPTYKKFGLDYVSCNNCGTLYINPRPSPEVLEKCYKESDVYAYWDKYIFPSSEKARREKMFKPRVDKLLEFCKKYNIATDSILEVGAAYGTFCEEMTSKNVFKRIVAIEPTPGLAQTCRNKNIETIESPVEKVSFPEDKKFDVVVSFEVIEHLFSPVDFINQCKHFLKPGGLFVATCPNGKGFDFVVLKELCNSIDYEHLNYFNPYSLNLLLARCDFETLEILTPGRLDAEIVRKKILGGEFDVSNSPFLKQVLIDNWETVSIPFQNFLAENQLSSSMWIIAKNHVQKKNYQQ